MSGGWCLPSLVNPNQAMLESSSTRGEKALNVVKLVGQVYDSKTNEDDGNVDIDDGDLPRSRFVIGWYLCREHFACEFTGVTNFKKVIRCEDLISCPSQQSYVFAQEMKNVSVHISHIVIQNMFQFYVTAFFVIVGINLGF